MPRFALITGASSGIGLALAEGLARRGHNLLLVARERPALESIAYELSQRFAVQTLFRVCDLGQPLQLTGLLHELEQGALHIDMLINNAGFATFGPYLEQDWRREQALIEVNVLASARLCHALGRHMQQRGGGQILNVASLAAFLPGPWMTSYHASKAYLLHFSEGLREELAPHGVKVSVLCPGPTHTGFFRKAGMTASQVVDSKFILSAETVAQHALQALEKNRAIIIPGWRNRLASQLPRLTPRWLLRRVAARVNRILGGSS